MSVYKHPHIENVSDYMPHPEKRNVHIESHHLKPFITPIMASNNTIKTLLAGTGLLLTGVALGLLLSPRSGRENRQFIKKSAHDAGLWVDHQTKPAREKARQGVSSLKSSVRETVKNKMPDLYEATDFHLDDREVLGSRENG
jgi:gas vesicle protein